MPLTLRHTRLDTPAGTPAENDYTVLEDGKVIGRIYKTARHEEEWFWGNNRSPNMPGHDRGYAKSLDEAKAEFRRAWETKKPGG